LIVSSVEIAEIETFGDASSAGAGWPTPSRRRRTGQIVTVDGGKTAG
jgi:hypothetical protein